MGRQYRRGGGFKRHAGADPGDTRIDLGPCCACGVSGRSVRYMILLALRAPVPGTGWGCGSCDLPLDGALAVLCDACASGPGKREPTQAIAGYATGKGRIPIRELVEPFDHDPAKHPGEYFPPQDDSPESPRSEVA